MTAKLIALVLPLGLDTLGVSLALGATGLSGGARTRLALLFAGFETAMPLIGLLLGRPLGDAIGHVADYIAAALVAGLGVYLLAEGGEDTERLARIRERGYVGALALGVSISLDELAIGFSAGLLRLPVVPMLIAIGIQAFVITLIGTHLGSTLAARAPEVAERLAGAALVCLAVALAAEAALG